MIDQFFTNVCPVCLGEWEHVHTSDHVICSFCATDLTLANEILPLDIPNQGD